MFMIQIESEQNVSLLYFLALPCTCTSENNIFEQNKNMSSYEMHDINLKLNTDHDIPRPVFH